MHGSDAVMEHLPESSQPALAFPRFNPARMEEIAEQAGSHAIVHELVDLFLGDVEARVRDLASTVQRNDDVERERVSHSIKGSCANLGAERMAELARLIEHCPSAAAPDLVRAIQREFTELERVLHETYPESAPIHPKSAR
ncbi:MAG TPA: Hpt domain-containing protein [Polyangiaceae bacterium]|nr:Hpt domain-containing protein [Polyangiaceae bacterium]